MLMVLRLVCALDLDVGAHDARKLHWVGLLRLTVTRVSSTATIVRAAIDHIFTDLYGVVSAILGAEFDDVGTIVDRGCTVI